MKKMLAILAIVVLAMQGAAWAEMVQGKVEAVSAVTKKIKIETDKGLSSVGFTAETKWPEGVTNPASLVGKKISIETNESGEATAVSLSAE